MNAHSKNLTRYRSDCVPTEADYARFHAMEFLHNSAPLFGEQTHEKPREIVRPEISQVEPVPAALPSPPMTTARVNNVAQPYLPTPKSVARPGAREVTIIELMMVSTSQKVRVGNIDIQVELFKGSKAPIYKFRQDGKSFHMTRLDLCVKNKPCTRRIRRDAVPAFNRLHRDLRSRLTSAIIKNSRIFAGNAGYLDSLKAGQYVIAKDRDNTLIFMVTGEKREKHLQYFAAIAGGLHIRLGTSVKVRRIPNGVSQSDSDVDKLLEFLQKIYTNNTQ